MILDYSNIADKSIFDFCKDTEMLQFITEQNNPNEQSYRAVSSQEDRIWGLRLLQFLTDSDELEEALIPFGFVCIDWDLDVFDFKDRIKESVKAMPS